MRGAAVSVLLLSGSNDTVVVNDVAALPFDSDAVRLRVALREVVEGTVSDSDAVGLSAGRVALREVDKVVVAVAVSDVPVLVSVWVGLREVDTVLLSVTNEVVSVVVGV